MPEESTAFNHAIVSQERKGYQFWLVFCALVLSLFLSALELSSLAPALPSAIRDLQGEEFAWAGTAYTLASTAFLPISAGVSQILGRKTAVIAGLTCFAFGSALCGLASQMGWFIAGRTIQGIGGGAIIALTPIVVSDMVPLSQRGSYTGITGMTWASGIAVGPLVGGSLAERGAWRWLFFLNIPISAIALLLVVFFMSLPSPTGSLKKKMASIDWLGDFLVISSSISLVIALTWGGNRYDWNSPRIIALLCIGTLGIVGWLVYEWRFAAQPMVPRDLLKSRTTVSGYAQIFFNSLVAISMTYYTPVYYQAVKGVRFFSFSYLVGPMIVIGGTSVRLLGSYRPQLWLGWLLFLATLSAFCFTQAKTPTALTIVQLIPGAAGAGLVFGASHFPILTPLPASANAQAVAFFTFARSLGQVWGVAVGSAILTNRLKNVLPPDLIASIPGGADMIYSIIPAIRRLQNPSKSEVQEAFAKSLRPLWFTLTGFLLVGFILSFLMEDIPLPSYLDGGKVSMKERKIKESDEKATV